MLSDRSMRPGIERFPLQVPAAIGTCFHRSTFSFRTRRQPQPVEGAFIMLVWALTFLIIALIAAVLGFGGIAGFAVEIAKIIFFVAIILFVISAIVGLVRGRTPTVP
jgi:uncharacterized membrane protein YtjA (UPF0391 family)